MQTVWTIVPVIELKKKGESLVRIKAPLQRNYPEIKLNDNPLKKKQIEGRKKEERMIRQPHRGNQGGKTAHKKWTRKRKIAQQLGSHHGNYGLKTEAEAINAREAF